MTVSQSLKDLSAKLQIDADSVMAKAEGKSQALLGLVAEAVASASICLEKAASMVDGKEPVLSIEHFETLAGLAQALDETGDEDLIKKASLLDELLVTVSAPKNAAAEAAARTEDEINALRDKYRDESVHQLYGGSTQKHLNDAEKRGDIAKVVDQKVKQFRPLETSLSTRYCPDHPGVSVSRIADRVYQCGLDKKVYNYETGFTTEKGNKVPGGGVEYQTPDFNQNLGQGAFDTRESSLNRFASATHTVSLDHETKQLMVEVPVGTDEAQKEEIKQKLIGTYGTIYPIVFKGASYKIHPLLNDNGRTIPFDLTPEEEDALDFIGNRYDSGYALLSGYDSEAKTISVRAVQKALLATKDDGGDYGTVPLAGGSLEKKIQDAFYEATNDDSWDDEAGSNSQELETPPGEASAEISFPDSITYWTADEVAECLPVSAATGKRLWELLGEAKNKTPLGGDGSDGTVETPDGRLGLDNDDKMVNIWSKLTDEERNDIVAAVAKEHGN